MNRPWNSPRKALLMVAAWMALVSPRGLCQSQTPAPVTQMASDANPSFEVATIRPTDPGHQSRGFHIKGHRIFIEDQDVNTLISVAFAIHQKQIVDAPAWFGTDRYDIVGVPDAEGQPNLRQLQNMIKNLLADRFQLASRREKRQLSVYAITVAKGGPKIAKSAGDPNGLPDQTGNGRGSVKFTNNSMSDFALGMQEYLEKPVVDQTDLAGRFDFTLQWTPNDSQTTNPDAPGIFTAVQEQLGLKLVPVKASIDVLVIDHAEKPSQN
jgi:uncharacterized protein (TIGR03435 family)